MEVGEIESEPLPSFLFQAKPMSRKGRILVFSGAGKGKTTRALGTALQAVARGWQAYMVQFMKAPDSSGEHFAAERLGAAFAIEPMGRKGFIRKKGPDRTDRLMAEQALKKARTIMTGGKYDVVILDEINVAVRLNLLDIKDVLDLMAAKPEHLDLVLTGRDAHPDICARADEVLEMVNVKHHFESGVKALRGIEY
jgi:cob(I)alamin adenosyltransferase